MNINSCVLTIVGFHLFQTIVTFAICSPVKSSLRLNPEIHIINVVEELGRKISHAQWTKTPDDNVVLSPLSIAVILNLLMLGSDGGTKEELKRTLNYSDTLQDEVIHQTFQNILLNLPQSSTGFKISLDTRLFHHEGSQILDSYRNASKNLYFTEIKNLDFRDTLNDAMETINTWASKGTNGKIRKVFPGYISPNTDLLPCSVLFLDAAWENKFNTNLTKDGIFNTGWENITIPMMTSDMKIPYVIHDKGMFEIIALPYEGKNYSMYILKPMNNTGISKLIQIEDSLDSNYLDSLIGQMKTQRIIVSIPRMRLSTNLDLKRDLEFLGVNQMFSKTSANFDKLSGREKLFVSDIFHQTILDVTEDGTSAAAVTTSVVSPTALPERFILDKPSLLMIRNNQNGLLIFWAKVIRPEILTA